MVCIKGNGFVQDNIFPAIVVVSENLTCQKIGFRIDTVFVEGNFIIAIKPEKN